MSNAIKHVLPAVLALATITVAGAQIQTAQPHNQSTSSPAPSLTTASRPATLPSSAALNLPNLPRPAISAGLALPMHSASVGGGAILITSGAVNGSSPRLSAQDLYYSGGIPVELFERFSPSQRVDAGTFGLDLHLPVVKATLAMGGGEVALNGGLMTLARSAGLAEAHLDIASPNSKFGIRVQGRAMYYRSPLMATPWISTANWVVTERPSFSAYYRF